MEIYEIHNLDCRDKKNRLKLVMAIKETTKQKERPSIELLEKFSKIVGQKYKMPVQLVKQVGNHLFVSICVDKGTYSTLECHSYYEALCKHILLVQAYKKNRKQKVK